MADYKTAGVTLFPSRDLKRAGQFDTVITAIETSTGRAMVVVIPSAKPTDKEIQDALAAEHTRQTAMIGKIYKV